MQSFNLENNCFQLSTEYIASSVLPSNSIILHKTPFTCTGVPWDNFFSACLKLKQQISTVEWVFIDACWDPFRLSNLEIQQRRQQIFEIFNESKVCILSAKAQHFYDDLHGCVYFPLFLMITYPEVRHHPRGGRIGCLNRRNAVHRLWLMHHLLQQDLLDAARDIYSVMFTGLFDDSYINANALLDVDWFNEAQRRWPKIIATHPDGGFNDYSINHPAWHTGIAIITETEPGPDTIISEKTAKGFLSKSCFSIYMGEVGYRVLEDLGFDPRYFPHHAEDFNIDPIINICKTFSTEKQALDYREIYLGKIQHNFKWFGLNQGTFDSRPWWGKFGPKLQQALSNL